MNRIVDEAVLSVQKSRNSFCKFISANDAGKTGAHQSGFYIPKNAVSLIFDTPGTKGTNKDRMVSIRWQNAFTTQSRFIYYGTGTRDEYRLTRFGKGFPFLTEDRVGDLLILSHMGDDFYEGYVLTLDEDIEDFFSEFNLTSSETNKLITKGTVIDAADALLNCFKAFCATHKNYFPPTILLSGAARDCYNSSFKITAKTISSAPDQTLLNWLDSEYELFKLIELDIYSEAIKTPFKSVEALIETANTILNRRKSRAGKSLEHHLAKVFDTFNLSYTPQAVTEDNKKPDFIFPNQDSYKNINYDSQKLVFLASKTTCKDRWRQVINEADRIKIKHLFTLQQGISKNQLTEMYKEGVKLVVPKPYLKSFPEEFRDRIFTLDTFIKYTVSAIT